MVQGLYKFHQYQVVGRHLRKANDENPQIYRMKLWATDAVRAKSKFWCVLALILPRLFLVSKAQLFQASRYDSLKISCK